MKRMLIFIALCSALIPVGAKAQEVGYCDCYGGIDVDGQYWKLLDYHGTPLEDGDWAYAAWTGPDGAIDPPDAQGYPTGDDVKLPLATEHVEYSTFSLTVATWERDSQDASGTMRHPQDGELIYCRIFDGPQESIGPDNHYADSQTHQVKWKMGDVFFCLFPGDPGGGYTDRPIPLVGSQKMTPPENNITAAALRQIYPHLLRPVVDLEYSIPHDAHVTMNIYDLIGHPVAILVDAEKKSGVYTERWKDGGLASSIYIAELIVGDFRVLKKIVSLKP